VDIELRTIDKDNWETVVSLSVNESQKAFVASNAYSLAEAAYTEASIPKAIYANGEAVGFIMYEALEADGLIGEYNIYRFMIDKHHQNKGIGRKALKLAISTISELPDCKKILICYVPNNEVAKAFYESVGFRELGLDESGEMVAVITTTET